jgi:hypothetical protein
LEEPQSRSGAAPRSQRVEYVYFTKYPDRMFVVSLQGARGLQAAMLGLALRQQDQPLEERSLWTQIPKMTRGRVQHEWGRFLRVIRPEIAKRLAIVAITKDGAWIAPHGDDAADIEKEARTLLPSFESDRAVVASDWSAPTPKFFEILKVLLNAWLRNEGPLTALEISARSGCSSPTVAAALSRLRRRDEIGHARNRPVELLTFPRTTLREVLALSESLRRPMHYQDASGRPPDPDALLRRVSKPRTQGIFVGGVAAARHYDRHFDLNGLPRVDVSVTNSAPHDWVRKLDPALRLVSASAPSPLLVVHPVRETIDASPKGRDNPFPWADPVETLLDLYEMRLNDQAEELVRVLRRENVNT